MKKNIAIVFGGDSGEFEISVKSAKIVKENIDVRLFNVYPILVTKKKWAYINEDEKEFAIDKNDFSILIKNKKVKFHCVFIAIHGTPGEDGKLQGYFDLLGIPYTSCGLAASAMTFNKRYCKIIAEYYGAKTAQFMHLHKDDKLNKEEIFSKLSLPFFVKPNNNGSSVGVSKVNKKSELAEALKFAFSADDEILIEEYIQGREVTNGVFMNNGKLIVLPITEIISKNEFFNYEAKYKTGQSEEITPARISKEIEEKIKKITALLYKKMDCKGCVRIDYIIKNNQPYFLEINTVPGLSEQSIIPQQLKVYGKSLPEFFTLAIHEAINKNEVQ